MTHLSLRSLANLLLSPFNPSAQLRMTGLRLNFFFLTMLLYAQPSFSQSQTDIKSRKIKSVTTLTTDKRKGDTTIRKNTSRYDAHGNVIESIDYDANGNVKDREQFQFNRHDDEVQYIHLSHDGKVLKKTVTQYNKWNNPVEKISYDASGNVIEKTSYTYNTSNDVVSEITNDKEGKVIRKTLYDYDNRGMLISRKIYNERDKLIYSRDFSIEY
ncbi:MAG TPA: hypothetical protein VE978_07645 [Chitinophagales bacterium]|nr:hypothetical protein [Chitinophagales bacterium]